MDFQKCLAHFIIQGYFYIQEGHPGNGRSQHEGRRLAFYDYDVRTADIVRLQQICSPFQTDIIFRGNLWSKHISNRRNQAGMDIRPQCRMLQIGIHPWKWRAYIMAQIMVHIMIV